MNDPFEFSAAHHQPFNSSMSYGTPPYDPVLSLEKDFCSNFSCCGLALPDMHQLLEHFEESHVVVFGQDGRPVYPMSDAQQQQSPSSMPLTSVAIGYPQPGPATQSPLSSAYHGYPNLFDSYDPFGFEMDLDNSSSSSSSSPITHSRSSVSSTFSSPNPSEPICLPPALLTIQRPPMHSPVPVPALSSTPRFPAPSDALAQYNQSQSYGDVPTMTQADGHAVAPSASTSSHRYQYPPEGSDSISAVDNARHRDREKSHPVGKTSQRLAATGPDRHARSRGLHRDRHDATTQQSNAQARRKDTREKQFKCPHPGCTKSYLNPNGLKYHLEKGTCSIDPEYLAMHGPPPARSSQNSDAVQAQSPTSIVALPTQS